jgi:hypothetical protein
MTHTFTTDDKKEAVRILKSLDMALFIFDLVANGLKDNDLGREEVANLLEHYDINIYELVD